METMMKNKYYRQEMLNEFSIGDAGKNLAKLGIAVKNLFKKAKSGESDNEEIHEEAEKLKTKVEQSKGSGVFKKLLMGIIISIMTISASGYAKDMPTNDGHYKQSSMEAKKDALFDKMEKDIAKAEAKYGKNFGSVVETWTDKSSAVERLAAVIDSKGDYNVKVVFSKKTVADGEEMRIFKFNDGSGMVWTKSGAIQMYDGLGNEVAFYYGHKADNLVGQAHEFATQHNNSVAEAKRILTKAGYTLLKT